MKKLFLLFFALCFGASFAQTTSLDETFSYGSTSNADITVASAGAWKRHSGTKGSQYSNQGLVFPGYPLSNVGGSLSFMNGSSGNNDGDVNRLFTKAITSNATLYVSFMLNVASAKATVDYFLHLTQSDIANATPGTTFRGKVWAISNGTGYSLGLTKAASSNVTMGTSILEFNRTYLVVLKYQFNTSATTDDLVTLYVLPTSIPTTEPSSAEVATLGSAETTADLTDVAAVCIRQGSNTPTALIDGIRVSSNWATIATSVEENISFLPTKYSLNQNYPNPFNPSTVINYQLPEAGNVSLKVYDVLGNEVATLVNEFKQAGVYNAKFANANLSSGIYLYRLQAGSFVSVKRMMLIK